MEHHAYESEQNTNAQTRETAVRREILLLVSSCEDYLIARRNNDKHMDAASARRMEVERTRYGHHLMTVIGEDAADDRLAELDIAVRRLAWLYISGAEDDVLVDDMVGEILSVLRGSTE